MNRLLWLLPFAGDLLILAVLLVFVVIPACNPTAPGVP